MTPAPFAEVPALGSNLRGDDGSSWLFTLPSLAPAHALVVGDVAPLVSDHLARAAGALSTTLPGDAAPASVDLVVLAAGASRGLLRSPSRLDRLRAVLTPDAAVVLLGPRGPGRRRAQRIVRALCDESQLIPLAAVDTSQGRERATGAVGGLLFPAPAGDRSRHVARARRLLARGRRRASNALGRQRRRRGERHASEPVPLCPSPHAPIRSGATWIATRRATEASDPPGWVRGIITDSGLEGTVDSWAFAPPRGYRSQKCLFLLARSPAAPHAVIKVTQEPRFNHRLLNEARALGDIRARDLLSTRSVPEVFLATEHAGLAVVVESAWVGEPFRRRSTADATCTLAAAAAEIFVELGERSASRSPDGTEVLVGAAEDLVRRYLDTFEPGAVVDARLRQAAAGIGADPPPTVFSHGDPGHWNLLIAEDDTIGILDWENADPAGPPMWDLVLFLKTYGRLVAERAGRRYCGAIFSEQFRPGSSLRPLVDRVTADYLGRVGMGPGTAADLTLLCWVHQALKEASRLPVGRASGAGYREVVERCVDDPALLWFGEA